MSSSTADIRDVVCHCYGVTRTDIRKHFETPGTTIDSFIDRTNIGKKCTACLLDFDYELGQLAHAPDRSGKAGEIQNTLAALGGQSPGVPDERLESGFFLNRDGVKTFIHLANHNPLFAKTGAAAPHRGTLWLVAPDGRVLGKRPVSVGGGEEITINLDLFDSCPNEGWFLLRLRPEAPGLAGTLRPQVTLAGQGFAVSYHTQRHAFATRSGWRSGVALRARNGQTRTGVPVINGSNRATDVKFSLHKGGPAPTEYSFNLPSRGFRIVEIDEVFPDLPSDTPMLLQTYSREPTRKFLLNRHPSGNLGVDHFPGLP